MAGTTGLEPAASAVTADVPVVTDRKSTAPIAHFGAPSNPREGLLHPDCTQTAAFWRRGNAIQSRLLPVLAV